MRHPQNKVKTKVKKSEGKALIIFNSRISQNTKVEVRKRNLFHIQDLSQESHVLAVQLFKQQQNHVSLGVKGHLLISNFKGKNKCKIRKHYGLERWFTW